MKKYKVFRSFGKVDEDIRKHELVAVEYGENIDVVTDKLVEVINEDATGLPQYQTGFHCVADGPERIDSTTRHVKRYQYVMTAILGPNYGETNDLLEYGIIEEDTDEIPARI